MLIYYISASLLNEVVLCKVEAYLKARERPLNVDDQLCFCGREPKGRDVTADYLQIHTEFSSIELCLWGKSQCENLLLTGEGWHT